MITGCYHKGKALAIAKPAVCIIDQDNVCANGRELEIVMSDT